MVVIVINNYTNEEKDCFQNIRTNCQAFHKERPNSIVAVYMLWVHGTQVRILVRALPILFFSFSHY